MVGVVLPTLGRVVVRQPEVVQVDLDVGLGAREACEAHEALGAREGEGAGRHLEDLDPVLRDGAAVLPAVEHGRRRTSPRLLHDGLVAPWRHIIIIIIIFIIIIISSSSSSSSSIIIIIIIIIIVIIIIIIIIISSIVFHYY